VKYNLNHIVGFKVRFYFLVSCVHVGGNTVEINTEAASSDITEYPPPDDKPSAGMFGFLCCYIVCIHVFLPTCEISTGYYWYWWPCPVSFHGVGYSSRYVTSHPGQLNLAISSWIGAMSTIQNVVTPCSWEGGK